ncbi:Co-chaperone Hsc20 [Ramicandelaber brevisporus]|nr:Co-chaperone Hsc20 [Ramicandelaber brevisporus]
MAAAAIRAIGPGAGSLAIRSIHITATAAKQQRRMPSASRQSEWYQIARARTLSTTSRAYNRVDSGENCWKCGQTVISQDVAKSVICNASDCGAVQPVPPNSTYFDAFGYQSATFDIDTADLRKQFLRLQQAVHPDGFANHSDKRMYQYASNRSTWLNHAYQTLREPLNRAKYILELHGTPISESDSLMDKPEFLMEVMEARETIAAAKDEADLEDVKEENTQRRDRVVKELVQAFRDGKWEAAKALTIELQYWEKIQRTITHWSPNGSSP